MRGYIVSSIHSKMATYKEFTEKIKNVQKPTHTQHHDTVCSLHTLPDEMIDAIFRKIPDEQLKLSMVSKHTKEFIDSQRRRDNQPRLHTDLLNFLRSNRDIEWAVTPNNTHVFNIDVLRKVVETNDDVMLVNLLKLMPMPDLFTFLKANSNIDWMVKPATLYTYDVDMLRKIVLTDNVDMVDNALKLMPVTEFNIRELILYDGYPPLQNYFALDDSSALLLLKTEQLHSLHITLAISYVLSARCDCTLKSPLASELRKLCKKEPLRIMLHVFAENDERYYKNGVAMCYEKDKQSDILALMLSNLPEAFKQLILAPAVFMDSKNNNKMAK